MSKNIKTISDLSNRMWYRLLKVIYVLSFVYFSVYVVGLIIEENYPHKVLDLENTKMVCSKGNEKTFIVGEVGLYIPDDPFNQFNSSFVSQAQTLCGVEKSQGSHLSAFGKLALIKPEFTRDDFELIYAHKTVGSYWIIAGLSIIWMIMLSLGYELMRRIFYYIVLGKIRPLKA